MTLSEPHIALEQGFPRVATGTCRTLTIACPRPSPAMHAHSLLLPDLVRQLLAVTMPGESFRTLGWSGVRHGFSTTLLLPRPLTTAEYAAVRALLDEAPSLTHLDLLRRRGPHLGEPAWATLSEATPSTELQRWAIRHYRAAGIDDDGSYAELYASDDWRYDPAHAIDTIRLQQPHSLLLAHVEAYAALLAEGVTFPPVIHRRRGVLREGYHRLAAHRLAGRTTIAVVSF